MLAQLRAFHGNIGIIVLPTLWLVLYMEIVEVGDPYFDNIRRGELYSQEEQLLYEASVIEDLQMQEPGLGEDGEPVSLQGEAKTRGDAIYQELALNDEVSKRISYNRMLDDSRHPACWELDYDVRTLPSASVIIIFLNEPYSVLVRTVHSTLNTCHRKILKEIILVDDGSTNVDLGGKLDYYIRTYLPSKKVKLLRLKNRLGVARARLAGARIATGDVLIFLDAHCEANVGWCEPLVQRTKVSRSIVSVPIIDVINAKHFGYRKNQKYLVLGGFQWNGDYDWIKLPDREKRRRLQECPYNPEICPLRSPTMAGGLFAIDRLYFWEMGSYDEQMVDTGGENLEMSFRIWQCGGTIEFIPCSRVGHVFRTLDPRPSITYRKKYGINMARMALVWMDEYVNIFFIYRRSLKFHPDIGDVTNRIRLREKLGCKSFDWYLKNVYPEKFVPTKNVIGYGRIKAKSSYLCLDYILNYKPCRSNIKPYNMGILPCRENLTITQFFSYTKSRVLRNEESCATVQFKTHPPYFVLMVKCLETDAYNDKWTYVNHQFMHEPSRLCLDYKGLRSMDDVRVDVCDSGSETQRWVITHDDDE